jgi:membrane protease YdiL (CAAX protease family)
VSDRGERLVISLVALSLPIAGTVTALVTRRRLFIYTTRKVVVMFLFEVLALAISWMILRARGWTTRPFLLHFDWTNLAGGFLMVPGYIALTWIVYAVGRRFTPDLHIVVRHEAPVWLVILFFVVNSYFEESFASAYLVESFERTGNAHAVTWAAAIRAAYHLYQGPLGAISIFFLGLAFAEIYRRTRDITLPFIAHTAINVVVLALQG